jgi:cyclohexadienyl dehydratase
MFRCEDLDKYKNFFDIDDKKNLVIENRGGTNEKFALEKLEYANLLIINDNLKAISLLLEGVHGVSPHIMITDSAEVEYQHSVNSNLCELPITIDKYISYKAFMFNQTQDDKKLANIFNLWLDRNPDILEKHKTSSV